MSDEGGSLTRAATPSVRRHLILAMITITVRSIYFAAKWCLAGALAVVVPIAGYLLAAWFIVRAALNSNDPHARPNIDLRARVDAYPHTWDLDPDLAAAALAAAQLADPQITDIRLLLIPDDPRHHPTPNKRDGWPHLRNRVGKTGALAYYTGAGSHVTVLVDKRYFTLTAPQQTAVINWTIARSADPGFIKAATGTNTLRLLTRSATLTILALTQPAPVIAAMAMGTAVAIAALIRTVVLGRVTFAANYRADQRAAEATTPATVSSAITALNPDPSPKMADGRRLASLSAGNGVPLT